ERAIDRDGRGVDARSVVREPQIELEHERLARGRALYPLDEGAPHSLERGVADLEATRRFALEEGHLEARQLGEGLAPERRPQRSHVERGEETGGRDRAPAEPEAELRRQHAVDE